MLAQAQGLKTINPPQGGKIVYGQVEGQTTEAGAMGAVLRSLHNSLGERPQVGKLFQVRGTESVAAFFSVSRKTQGGGQVAGMIIVAKAATDHVEAALVSDDAARFPKTLGPMMKTLFGVWHPLAVPHAGGASGPAAPLRPVTLSDNSASLGLPDGWKLVPRMSAMGTAVAEGPHDEEAQLGLTFLAGDTNNPRVQQTMQAVRAGRLHGTVYEKGTYYPYGGDMGKAYVYLMQDLFRHLGGQPATYNLTTVSPVQAPPPQRCVHIAGTVKAEGKETRELNGVYCAGPPTPVAGNWMSEAFVTVAPVSVAAGERATLGAILQSFKQNAGVIDAQAGKIAAPAIIEIHAIGQAAANQAAAAHQRNDIQNSSVYQHWDSMDKRSQEFENYQLGYTVIADTQNNAHGTFWNADADALVKSNPDRFEYVSAPNYWKGIDY
jgi:hypothetical protein